MKTGSRPSATRRQASSGPIRFGSSSTDILLQPDATGPADRTKRPGGVVGSGSRRGRLVLSVGRLREYIKRETARETARVFSRAKNSLLPPRLFCCTMRPLARTFAVGSGRGSGSRQPPRLFIHLFFPRRNSTDMAKTIATILGIVFILVGIVGFVSHDFLGTHLTMTHNLVHIVSGALALYFGLAGSLSGARLFCVIFGIVYGLLGVCGFLLGSGNDRMLAIDDLLMLGTMDHIVHILLGVVFLIGGFMTRAEVAPPPPT